MGVEDGVEDLQLIAEKVGELTGSRWVIVVGEFVHRESYHGGYYFTRMCVRSPDGQMKESLLTSYSVDWAGQRELTTKILNVIRKMINDVEKEVF